jgi:hypothetical protein
MEIEIFLATVMGKTPFHILDIPDFGGTDIRTSNCRKGLQ